MRLERILLCPAIADACLQDLDTYACVSLLYGHEAEVIALRCSG